MKKRILLSGLFLFFFMLPFKGWASLHVPASVYEWGPENTPVPISEVKVDLFSGLGLKTLLFSTETGADGACLLKGIPLGKEVLVRLTKAGYIPQFDIRSYSEIDKEKGSILWMAREAHVEEVYKNFGETFNTQRGHLYLEIRDELTGEGIEGVRLRISSGRAFDLGRGEYLIANAKGTSLRVGMEKPGHAFDIESVTIPLFPGGITQYDVVIQSEGISKLTGDIETVAAPTILSGVSTGLIGQSYVYTTGGSNSSIDDPIQYLFDWGDGTNSDWLLPGNTSASKSWSLPGTYPVKSRARCSIHQDIVSDWSEILLVTISLPEELVSTPSSPSGPLSGLIGVAYTYSTGAASSNLGDPIQYLFDWGDGTDSGWLAVGTTTAEKVWNSPGTYPVRVRARCANHPSVLSNWSLESSVTISPSSISLLFPPQGEHFEACSLYTLPTFSWGSEEAFKKYQIQFSPYENFGTISVKVKAPGSATESAIKSTVWKKILLIPGEPGGLVYWRVIGTRSDNSQVTSDVRSFIVDPAEPVGNPVISNTSQGSLPELTWENRCSVKFKVWFGKDESFSKKATFKFNVSNPTDNGELLEITLTSSQWKKVRNLVGDVSGSTIYWYVESWDLLKRESKTETMSFVLTE